MMMVCVLCVCKIKKNNKSATLAYLDPENEKTAYFVTPVIKSVWWDTIS